METDELNTFQPAPRKDILWIKLRGSALRTQKRNARERKIITVKTGTSAF